MKLRFLAIFTLLLSISGLQAAYLKDIPRQLIQPNGDTLHCFATGDEYHHWLHDANGFTIVQNPATGYFVYATKSGEQLIPTQYVAGTTDPASVGLVPYLNISAEQWSEKRAYMEGKAPKRSTAKDFNRNHGVINNIVIFIRFSDDTGFSSSFSNVNNMFNDSSPGANSMYNYFKSTSYDQLEIVSTFYPVPSGNMILSYQDPNPRSYYQPYSASNPDGYTDDDTEREHALLQRAVNAVSASIPSTLNLDYDDDGYVDNICFVVKGNVGDWSDLLWPHRFVLYTQNVYIGSKQVWDYNFQLEDPTYFENGTLCHEMFHTLGAPDLYHYYVDQGSHPVGVWDVMAVTANPPQQPGAYMKYLYGNWLSEITEITLPGIYTLYPINSATSYKVAYVIASENPDEYFVLEYRKETSPFDQVSGSGIIMYRINSLFMGRGNAQYDGVEYLDEVYVYRPAGDTYASNAYFSANTGRTSFTPSTNPYPFLSDGTPSELSISNITMAGDSIQFTYGGGIVTPYLNVQGNSLNIGNEINASTTFSISSNVSWNITGTPSWLDLSALSGSGDLLITLTATEVNYSLLSRSCTLVVSGAGVASQNVVVIQPGYIAPSLEVSVPTLTLDANAGSSAPFTITSNISWTISGAASWVQLSTAGGSNNETVSVTATEANPNTTERACTLVISGSGVTSKNVLVIQSAVSGISDFSNDKAVLLYPNPAKDVLSVKINPTENVKYAAIFNMYGQEVLRNENINSHDFQWNISSLKRGVYSLQLFFDNKTITKKIVIE